MFRLSRRSLLLTSAALALAFGAACNGDDAAPSTTATPAAEPSPTTSAGEATPPTVAPITDDILRNATIPTDLVGAGEVELSDGAYAEAAASGSASMIEFAIESTVLDDFDGDGVDDGAMIVRSSGGGSGTFYTLHVFVASDGGPERVASESLGDRIQVQGIESGPDGVTVTYLDRAPDAPMSSSPDIPATRTVAIGANGSVTVSGTSSSPATGGGTTGASGSGTAGDACATLAPEAYDAAFTFVTNLTAGDYLESGDEIIGCSRTFESHVPWRLEDREGNVVAESFAMGGGVDGPAPFAFVVEYSVASAQVGHLFVGGDDPSDGEGFPPVTNQIPVVLLP